MSKICNSKVVKLVITGGHHSSAIPVIKKIRESRRDVEIHWVGHKRSMKGDENDTLEYKEITSMGIPFHDLKAGKVYRTGNIGRLLRVPFGVFQSLYLLIKVQPDVILSFGGYLAAPVVLAGWFLGIPSVTHEQTVVSGYANKVIALFAKKIFLSWPQSAEKFPKGKALLTGIPLRDSVFKISSDNFKISNDLPTVFVTAGKTGSHFINNLIFQTLEELLGFCNIIHQCGDNSVYNDFDNLLSKYSSVKNNVEGIYYPRKFIFEDEVGEAYSKSDLVVARSGAHTVAELLALQKPCILIPIPWVSHNEQNKNALMLETGGTAKILDQNLCTPEVFAQAIKQSLEHLSDYSLKDESLLSLLKSDSAELIANETLNAAKKL
jgi:UDP-N-acetylglucosamine--N-acetylmuramyl-(pentapeptide) pyrophosphoryl-undecaprenol N-acetylglucosamine transferase